MTRPALIFLLLIAPLTARAQDGDETSLRGAGLGTGPEFLAEYLRQRTRDVIPAEESSRLIGELATEASAVAAAEKLVQRGPGVVVALRRARNDAVRAAYERFCRKLARQGLPRHPAEGPLVYARRAAQCRPEAALEIASITERYVALRYGDSATPQAVHEFQHSVRRFAS